jgi:hypothetical protein
MTDAQQSAPVSRVRWTPIDTATADDHRLVDRCTLIALACALVPLIVALAVVGGNRWYPTGDMAQAELHMRGFFRHPPLVGAAGRIGDFLTPYGQGSHPGPAMWVALLPVYALLGWSAFGLMVSVTVVHVAFMLLGIGLARRLAGPIAGLAVATLCAVLVHSLGPMVFIEPWNPWPALFAFLAFLVSAWGVLAGRVSWLPITVFCGIFAVQCHAGYVPLVGAILAITGIVVLTSWLRSRRAPASPAADPEVAADTTEAATVQESKANAGRSFLIAVGVLIALWIPPVVDQLRREPGNLRLLWRHFASSTDADGTPRQYVGAGSALRAFAGEFSLAGPWVRGPFRAPTDQPQWILTIGLAAVVTAAAASLWRMQGGPARQRLVALFQVLVVAIVIGIFSVSRIFGEFYEYVMRWWWIIVGLVTVAAALVAASHQRSRRIVLVGCVAASLFAAGFATANAVDAEVPSPRNSELVEGVTPQVAALLDPAGSYLIRWYDPATLGGVPYGVLLELERDGFRVGVDAPASAAALPHRVIPEPSATAVLWVVAGDLAIQAFRDRSDATELGFFDQRSEAEVATSNELRERLVTRLNELDLSCLVPTLDTQYGLAPLVIGNAPVPQDVRVLAGEYNLLGLPVAVFSVPLGAPSYVVYTDGC